MKRFFKTLVLALLLVAGAWALYHRDQINGVSDVVSLLRHQFLEDVVEDVAIDPKPLETEAGVAEPPVPRSVIPFRQVSLSDLSHAPPVELKTIRIASFKIHGKGELRDPKRVRYLAEIIRQFDVIAIQDDDHLDIISSVVNYMNQKGFGDYRFVDRRDKDRTFAIVFDQRSLILDNKHWYSVNDPQRLLTHEPLVAWFRAKNAPPEEAFTFTLANLDLDAEKAEQELEYLTDLFRAIREDGRGEDDIVIAGDFKCGDEILVETKGVDALNWVIAGKPTNTENTVQMDNIMFQRQATIEYTGNGGVYDFMSRLNTTLAGALTISNHMPVWGEFSILEGQSPGRISSASGSPYRIE